MAICLRKSFEGLTCVRNTPISLEPGHLFDAVAGEGQPGNRPGCQNGGGVTNELVAGDADVGMNRGWRELTIFGCNSDDIIGGQQVVTAFAE